MRSLREPDDGSRVTGSIRTHHTIREGASMREQHDAEFTSYIEKTSDHVWGVVYKGVYQGFYRTREEARKKIRSLKLFRRYFPLPGPWNRFSRILREVYDPT